MRNIIFSEKKKYNQKWLWIILFFLAIIPISLLVFGKDFKLGASGGYIGVTVMLLPIILISLAELRVEVSEDSLKYQFFPFHIKVYEIRFADIDSFTELIYSPLKDYGGWGIKNSFSGIAYNVSGNKGVKIFLKNGKKVLFGTQKPHKFFEALNKATQQ